MAETLDAAVLVLADLHLGNGYLDEPLLPPLDYSTLVRLLRMGGRLEAFFRKKCVGHNEVILNQLPRYLAAQLHMDGKRVSPGQHPRSSRPVDVMT